MRVDDSEPRSSAITCTLPWTLLTKHTRPSVPTLAAATFGSIVPGPKLTFDASGGVTTSDEISWPLPGAVAATGVRFTSATSPGAPDTSKHTRSDGAAGRGRHRVGRAGAGTRATVTTASRRRMGRTVAPGAVGPVRSPAALLDQSQSFCLNARYM